MSQRKIVKKKSSGCCWKKLLGKAFNKRDDEQLSSNIHQQDEIVYLNLYLTSLEKKMQAIEEVARLKWYRKEMTTKSKAEGRTYIRSGFRYLMDGACKPYVPTSNQFLEGPYNQLLPADQYVTRSRAAMNTNHPHSIIKEIMSLGNNNLDYENRKWSALTSPPITDRGSIIGSITEVHPSTNYVQYTVKNYQVAALSYPVEIYAACNLGEVNVQQKPRAPIKASCCISYFDAENKTIEITYDNREWDKRGVILLKDIENQAGVQAELIGRVICFLLGMGEEI